MARARAFDEIDVLDRAAMALRWTGAAMLEAAEGFRRLKAYCQLPILKNALMDPAWHSAAI